MTNRIGTVISPTWARSAVIAGMKDVWSPHGSRTILAVAAATMVGSALKKKLCSASADGENGAYPAGPLCSVTCIPPPAPLLMIVTISLAVVHQSCARHQSTGAPSGAGAERAQEPGAGAGQAGETASAELDAQGPAAFLECHGYSNISRGILNRLADRLSNG